MAAITNYSTLSTAIDDFTSRSYTSDEKDRIIGLAESAIRLYLPPHFAKEASETLTITSGAGTLVSGYIRTLSLVHATYGKLTQKSIGDIRERRIFDTSGIPDTFAVTGSSILVAPSFTGSLTHDYEGSLTGLSSGNTTNWLITNAPHAYLQACLAVEKFYQEDFSNFALIQGAVGKTLDDLSFQAIVSAQGRAGLTLPGSTP